MARIPGSYNIPTNYEVQITAPFDARTLVNSYADLLNFTSADYIYNGFLVSVVDTDPNLTGVYQLIDKDNPSDSNSWQKLGSGGGTSGGSGAQGAHGAQGAAGTSGTSGQTGAQGVAGVGIPAGGSTGQILSKKTGSDYDTEWINNTGGGGSGSSGTSGVSGNDGASGTSGTSGQTGVSGAPGTSGTSGQTGVQGVSGTSGTSGQTGAQGASGPQGASGTAGTSGTSTGSVGTAKMYQVTVSYSANVMDGFPSGLVSAVGPNGENLSALQTAGWVFTRVDGTTLQISRPSGSQAQPLVNILTHGLNSGNIWTKAPSGISSASYSALQTYSGGLYTSLTVYGLNSSFTGIAGSGTTNLTITFGLIS